MKSLKESLTRHHNNYRGWRTKRKIVVIESDDWGSICMPSPAIQQALLKKNYPIHSCPYATYDALASEKDLDILFSVLSDFRDSRENPPVITANTIMANPDFQKIRESGFQEYYYELFTETLKRFTEHEKTFNLWQQGMEARLFYPQFHGREHLNIQAWLKELRDEDSNYRAVFNDNVTWLGPDQNKNSRINIRASYDTEEPGDIDGQKSMTREGLDLFEDLFGYKSKSFIAPNFIYPSDLNETLSDKGVHYIQGMKYQKLPLFGNKERQMVRHYHGEKNKTGQYHLIRNCVFEPSQFPESYDSVGECLKGIKNAFFWNKPAVITAHRLNFIGYIDPENREKNLKLFRELLGQLLNKWPDVEFMTSVELGGLIAASEK